ncbi:MAG: hypothetical protein Q7R85_00355, partial [bacterium]|nr:hypothetical protein [bacterium]
MKQKSMEAYGAMLFCLLCFVILKVICNSRIKEATTFPIYCFIALLLYFPAAAHAFNGPPPGNPPTGNGSIVTDASNRVGIGTASPDQLLTVKNGMVHVANGATLTTTPGSTAGYGLFIGTDNATGESRIQTYWNTGTSFLTFHTNTGGLASVERARIDANGLTTTGFKLTTGPAIGYVLTSDATGVGTWQATAGDITGVTAGTGLTGGGVSGTVTLNLSTPVTVANGGTSGSNALTARANLGAAASGANSDITSIAGLTAPLAATQGGTAQSTYATGDLLYASGVNTLSKRIIGTAGQVLTVSGGIPTWAALPSNGTVTSVSGSGGTTGLTLSGGPITTTGTLTL